MVKESQTIRRLLPTNCLSVFDHFMGLALKGLRNSSIGISFKEYFPIHNNNLKINATIPEALYQKALPMVNSTSGSRKSILKVMAR